MKISVIGTGYVGLVSGACLADIGHQVSCVDIDPRKVDQINQGFTPIYEAGLEDLLQRNISNKLLATLDFDNAVLNSELTLIAVGTPFDGQAIDLQYIEQVSRQIGEALRKKSDYHVVVVKSTVVPGTTDNVVRKILEESSEKKAGVDFGVGMNPEFLTEGVAVRDFENPDRIVLGGMDEKTIDVLAKVYEPFESTPILRTNNKTAEMIKYTSNSVLAAMISFSNEIASLCHEIGGVDITDVMRGVHLAHYFTTNTDQGPVKAPISSFLEAGCGYGGSCLPKDTKALKAQGKQFGLTMPVLSAVIDTNSQQTQWMIKLAKKHYTNLEGINVCVLGLAFKPDTDDMRESPAITLIHYLLAEGAKVVAHDPIAIENAATIFADQPVLLTDDLVAALVDADIAMLVTRWAQYEDLAKIFLEQKINPLVVDGRRMLEKNAFERYEGIGFRAT